MRDTRPIFIVGSGRSGTAALAKLLANVPDVEMHHEYLCTHIQPVAVRHAMGLATPDDVRDCLSRCHAAAIALSAQPVWGDSSNKLSWILPILAEMFPDARIAHVVRDGRKVSSSFFHKLGDEIYDDASVAALNAWCEGDGPMPPPEKRYWWPIPQPGHPNRVAFGSYDQFQRIAHHWAEVNRAILDADLPAGMLARFRLEDLVSDEASLRDLFGCLDLRYDPDSFAAMRRPHNVNRPEDRLLTETQRVRFDAIAGPMMQRLGYGDAEEYRVDYNPATATQ